MKNMVMPFITQVRDCPWCEGGYMVFSEDNSRLPEDRHVIECGHCKHKATGHTWRIALDKWNNGKKGKETIEA